MNHIQKYLSRISNPVIKEMDYEKLLPKVVNSEQGIPHQIFQIYITPEKHNVEIPDIIKQKKDKILFNNPGWTYKLYTNNDIESFIKENYGDAVLSYYHRIDPQYLAVKADLFRYLLLYKKGGVYHDLKIDFSIPFDQSLRNDDEYILSHWDNLPGDEHEGWGLFNDKFKNIPRGELLMGFLMSKPGHPFLKNIIIEVLRKIDAYNPHIHNIAWWGTMNTTGPVMYTTTIYRMINDPSLLEGAQYRFAEIKKDLGFQYAVDKIKKVLKTDYRKATHPIIKHNNVIIQSLNETYFSTLAFYRERILRKQR